MHGLKLIEKGKVELSEKPTPKPGQYEALIRVTAATTCNTDLEIVEELVFPTIVGNFIGHECVGVIEEVGADVEYFKPGDRVCVPSLTPDWRTMEAQQNYATFGNGIAFEWGLKRDGTFADYICCRDVDMNCGKIPDTVTDTQAAIISDMATTAFQGVDNANILIGDSVVIFGCGPVGLCTTAAVAHKGAARIFVIGSNPKGTELAKQYGATDIISYKDGDVVEQIIELNGGPVDDSIIAGGPPSTVAQAIALNRPGGNVVNVNAFYGDVVIPQDVWFNGLKTQHMSWWQCAGSRWIVERYLAFIEQGRFDPTPIFTHVNHGIDELEKTLWQKKDKDVLKPICLL